MTKFIPVKHKEKLYHFNHFNYKSSCTTYCCHINEFLKLHTTANLPSVGKEYMCFQNNGKTAQKEKCIKSRIMTKVVDYVLLIGTFS